MKKLILIFVLLYTTCALADEYVRSIRVASFTTQKRMQKTIENLKVLSLDLDNCGENIVYRIRKIGIYYVLSVEPFRNKLLLQGTLDKIKTHYPDAYVSKYKKTDDTLAIIPIAHKIIKKEKIVKKQNSPKVIEKIKTVTKVVIKKEYIESQYKILFYLIFALFVGTLFFFISKKSNKKIPNDKEKEQLSTVEKEEELEDKFDDIDNLDLDLDDDFSFEETVDALDLLGDTRDNLRNLYTEHNSELTFKIEKIVADSKVSIQKIKEYSSQNREIELLEEILFLKSLSESLALYLDTTVIESMKSEKVMHEVDKITLLLDDLSPATKNSQTKSS